MFDIGEAFGYPLEGDDVASNLLIGSLLLIAYVVIAIVGVFLSLFFIGFFILPFAIIPLLLLFGYIVKILETTLVDESIPPTFDDWKELGMDGGRAFIVTIVYQLPAYAIMVGGLILTVGLGVAAGGAAESGGPGPAFGAIFGGGALTAVVLAGLYLLVAMYVLPAAICTMAADGSINGAFDFGNIKDGILTADYAVGWLIAAGVLGVIGQIGQFLMVILVGFPIVVYSYMVSARLIGSGFREGLASKS